MQHAETDIRLLANLFKEHSQHDESDEEDSVVCKSSITPANIGKKKHAVESIYTKKAETKRITEEEFMKNEEEQSEYRDKPEYTVSYRQAIGSEDVFLQMGGRTPATMSCEDMILTINLPGEDRASIDLNTTYTKLELTSAKFKLDLPFEHPVDPQRSSAKWDSDTQKLIITLRLDREFDFVNF